MKQRGGATERLSDARDAAKSGNIAEAAQGYFQVLDRYPDAYEAHLAAAELRETLGDGAAGATAAREMATMAEQASAPARKAACEAVLSALGGDGEMESLLADTAVSAMRAYPNAPESYDFPGYLMASGNEDSQAAAKRITADLPGTLAAWRCAALLTGAEPPLEELASAEARYGLVRAQSDRAKGRVACDDAKAAGRLVLSVSRRSFWDFPQSAVQARIAPLYADALKELPRAERAPEVMGLMREVNAAPTGVAAWMVRGVLYDEMVSGAHAWGEASFQKANQMDLAAHGALDGAMADQATDPRDKARIAYYQGLAYFNNGWEHSAVRCFDEALTYPCSDVIREYALYARAYALASIGWYTTGMDAAVEAYQAQLAAHPHGEMAAQALLQLARIYYHFEDYDSGNVFAEEVLRGKPDGKEADMARAMLAGAQTADRTELARNAAAAGPQECGPVALMKLLAAEGIPATVDELARLAGTDGTGTSMQGLVDAATSKGLPLAGVQIARGAAVEPPFIAFVNGNHFVLVREKGDRGYLVEDVDGSMAWQEDAVFRFGWDGAALVPAGRQQVAALLEADTLRDRRGGDSQPSNTNTECRNGHVPPCDGGCDECPPPPPPPPPPGNCGGGGSGGVGGPGGGTSMGFLASDSGGSGRPGGGGDPCNGRNTEDLPSDPGLPPGAQTATGRTANGYNPQYMLFQGTFYDKETDFSVPVAGGMRLTFSRHFANQFGYPRNDYSNWFYDEDTQQTTFLDLPYRNSIGMSWSHNLNMHLRVSQEYGFVVVYDEMGNPTTYTRHCETPQGGSCTPATGCICTTADSFPYNANADYYVRNTPPDWEAHGEGYKGELWEEGVVLTRHLSGGQTSGWSLSMPNGTVYGFAPETAWDEHYARLEYIQGRSGAQVTLSYDAYGRIDTVNAPSGDGRYLDFQYSGTSNRIMGITLKDGTTPVHVVYYGYGTNETLVAVDNDNDSMNWPNITYGYSSDANYPGSFMLSSHGKGGFTASISYTWGASPPWTDQPMSVTVTKGGIQKTTFTNNAATGYVTAINYDQQDNPVSKTVYCPDWYATTIAWVRFYTTPGGSNYQQWSYEYNADHFLTKVKRPTNNSGSTTDYMTYTYNGQGRTLTETEKGPNGNNMVTSYQYDASGLLPVSRTDPNGLTTEYVYDTAGRLIQMKHPSWGTNGVQYAYNTAGLLSTVTDPLGRTTTYGYDAQGNRTSATNALNQTTTMTYDDLGRLVQSTNPLGKTTSYTYIAQGCDCGGVGKLSTVTDPENRTTSFQYDATGNMTRVTDPSNYATDYQYDNLGRLVKVISPSGTTNWTTFTLDTLGRVLSSTDFGGKTVSFTYDHLGRVVTRTDAVGTVSTAYDTMGNATSVTDERGKVTYYGYLQGGWMSYMLNPAYKWIRHFYDSAGRLTKTGAGSGGTVDPTEYTYSATTGLVTKARFYSGAAYHDADFTYDAAGRVTKTADWVDATFGLQYVYDDLGRLSQKKEYSTSKVLSYTYDAAGRIASMTDPNGQTTSYTYTDAGRLASLSAPGGKVWNFQYNSLGQRTQYTHPNGIRTEYGYDTRHRLTSIIHRNTANNAVLDSFTFTLDAGGNITRVAHADSSRWDYTYDGRDRIAGAERRDPSGQLLHSYTYTHDAANNVTQRTKYTASSATTDTWVFAYNDANEQTGMTLNGGTAETRTYDGWGRLASRAQGSYAASYGYRYGGRLHAFTSNFPGEAGATLQYRGDGRLYQRTVGADTFTYRYDAGWNPVNMEYANGTLASTSVYAPGTAVGERLAYAYGDLATGTVMYACHDQLGSVRRWRTPSKGNWGANEFEPYGEAYAIGAVLAPRDYALHEWDPALAVYRAPYRNYSPTMTRWTTRDPLGMIDGPNMYGYVGGKCIEFPDASGLVSPLGWAALVLAVLAAWSTYSGWATIACKGAQCAQCMSNAIDTASKAVASLKDPEQLYKWVLTAQPGSECVGLCGDAAMEVTDMLLGILQDEIS